MAFLISNVQILIYCLVLLLVSHENEILVLWLAVNNMRPQQKLPFLFYVKKYFGIKKKRLQKLMTFWQTWHCFLLRWENMLVVLKWTWYLWPFMAITKAQLLPFDKWNMRYPSLNFCNFCLLKIFTYIKALFFLINRFCPAMCFFFFLTF